MLTSWLQKSKRQAALPDLRKKNPKSLVFSCRVGAPIPLLLWPPFFCNFCSLMIHDTEITSHIITPSVGSFFKDQREYNAID